MSPSQTPVTADKNYTIAIAKGSPPTSLECAGKAASGNVGFFSSGLNLIKTIMGSGMLVLPFAFQQVGLLPAICLLSLAAFVSALGLYLLSCANLRVANGRNADFATLARATFPRLTPVFDLAILLKCLGVTIGYLVVIGEVCPELVKIAFKSFHPIFVNPVFWVSTGAIIIAPVVYMPKMDSLKYTSFLGMLSIVYMVILSAWIFFSPTFPRPAPAALPPFTMLSWLKNFGVFVFSFTCHQNMLPIQKESKSNGRRDMLSIIAGCVTLSLFMYVIFGSFNFSVFGAAPIPDNILRAYPKTGAAFVIARVLYVFLVLSSLPLQTFPARNSTAKIINYYAPLFAEAKAKTIYYASSTAIFGFCWIIACTGLNLNFLLRIVGSTAGPILCYILPSLFWLSLESGNGWDLLKISSVGLLVFGLTALIISTAALFL